MGQTAQSLTCSIMEKPHTGLDDCLNMLLSCLRKRISAQQQSISPGDVVALARAEQEHERRKEAYAVRGEGKRDSAHESSRNLRPDSLPQHFRQREEKGGGGDETSVSGGESSAVIRRPKPSQDVPSASQDVPRRPKNSGGGQGVTTATGTGTWSSKRHGMYLQQSHPHQSVRASIAVMNVPGTNCIK